MPPSVVDQSWILGYRVFIYYISIAPAISLIIGNFTEAWKIRTWSPNSSPALGTEKYLLFDHFTTLNICCSERHWVVSPSFYQEVNNFPKICKLWVSSTLLKRDLKQVPSLSCWLSCCSLIGHQQQCPWEALREILTTAFWRIASQTLVWQSI